MRRRLVVGGLVGVLALILLRDRLPSPFGISGDASLAFRESETARRGDAEFSEQREGVLSALPTRGSVVTSSGVRLQAKVLRPPAQGMDALIAERAPPAPFPFVPPGDLVPARSVADVAATNAIDALLGEAAGNGSPPEGVSAVASNTMGLIVSAVLTRSQMEVVERELDSVSRARAKLIDDDQIEVWLGGDRIVCSLQPGDDGFTVEAELYSVRNGTRGVTTHVTVWDGQVILFSEPEGGSGVLSLDLSLENPAELLGIAADDPFAKIP